MYAGLAALWCRHPACTALLAGLAGWKPVRLSSPSKPAPQVQVAADGRLRDSSFDFAKNIATHSAGNGVPPRAGRFPAPAPVDTTLGQGYFQKALTRV
jgi:hypothetical protein